MTDRMRDEQLDREISNFLALRADEVANAPSASEMAARISSRVGTRTVGLRLTPQLVWVLLAGLLIAALLGAVLIGARLLRNDLPPSRVSNGWIAVSANPQLVGGGEVGDIYLVTQGAAARRIIGSDGDGVAQACPSFSPDGRRLAYGEARASEPVTTFRGVWPVTDRAIVIVGVNNQGDLAPRIVRVTVGPDPGPIPCPEWSSTGKYVAFRVGPELWIADTTSGETRGVPVTLEQDRWEQNDLEWSRDGSLIAVSEPGQIRVVRVEGGASTVIPVKGATPGSLGWTAGDDRIVYVSTDLPGDGQAVNVVDVDGNHDTRLTPDAVADLQVTSSGAVVSPDGTRLAYVQTTFSCVNDGCSSGSSRVLTMDPDGSNVTLVPVPQDFGVLVQWSPDGERLLFGSIAGVVSVAVAPGSAAVVHSSGELNLEWSGSEVTWQPLVP